MQHQVSLSYAKKLDREDPIRHFRRRFLFPKHEGKPIYYFCGNSLGLQPVAVQKALLGELRQWKEYAVEGHFRGEMPWVHYHKFLVPQSARLAGALESEVVVMNTLTANLHLLMVSFYRPTSMRYKIIMEAQAFPSDQYAVESQVRWHGYRPEDAIVEVTPRPGEHILRTEDIITTIEKYGKETALVLFGGVNYYTGQFFDIEKITMAAHRAGAYAGFDLAHAIGNLPLKLHDWNVDFACWCSYKYLNSGPGGPGGIFVHEKHGRNPETPRFAGWWGHDENERFQMKKGFIPMVGAAGWQLSNAQVLSMAAHKASLDIFDEVGMNALRQKSIMLTGYLEFLLENLHQHRKKFEIITPKDPTQRGCQLSILTGPEGRELYQFLTQNGVMTDWREPNVIRLAPVPLYNRFEDCWHLARLFLQFFEERKIL